MCAWNNFYLFSVIIKVTSTYWTFQRTYWTFQRRFTLYRTQIIQILNDSELICSTLFDTRLPSLTLFSLPTKQYFPCLALPGYLFQMKLFELCHFYKVPLFKFPKIRKMFSPKFWHHFRYHRSVRERSELKRV